MKPRYSIDFNQTCVRNAGKFTRASLKHGTFTVVIVDAETGEACYWVSAFQAHAVLRALNEESLQEAS